MTDMDDYRETLVGLFTEVAIIEHLLRTRMEKSQSEGLIAPHFGILNYFVRNHDGPDTVSGIAWSFQDPEDVVRERVEQMAEMGYLHVMPTLGNAEPLVSVTAEGRAALEESLNRIEPEILELVSEISPDDLARTFQTLRDIRLTLDNLPDR